MYGLCRCPYFQVSTLTGFTVSHTWAEIHGESSKAYRMKLSPLEQKILRNIQLGLKVTKVIYVRETIGLMVSQLENGLALTKHRETSQWFMGA